MKISIPGIFCAAAVVITGIPAWADTWPTKPVKLVLPGPPAGTPDRLSRIIAERLSKMWGQPVLIDHKPGAATRIGTEIVARAPADGYTLLTTFSSHSMTKLLYPDTPYDPVKDFTAITTYAAPEVILAVRNDSPYKSLKDLDVDLKASNKPLRYGHFGTGTPFHMWGLMVGRTYGFEVLPVAYKGESLSMTDLLGNHIESSFNSVGTALPHIKAGKIRALGILATSRSKVLPDVPTFGELGVENMRSGGWFGFLAPTGTPQAIVDKVAADVGTVVQDPEVAKEMRDQGIEPFISGPAQLKTIISQDQDSWRKPINEFNIKID